MDSYDERVGALAGDAERMEALYHEARGAGEDEAFRAAIDARYGAAPDNLLYAAWYHRLRYAATRARGYAVAWGWVVPLAIANGLLFWLLSDDGRFTIRARGLIEGSSSEIVPTLVLLAAPLSALFVLTYLTAAGRWRSRLAAGIGVMLAAATGYVLLTYPQLGVRPFQEQYVALMALHLPLLAWAGVGWLLVVDHRDPANRFALLIKSLEVFVVGGLLMIAGGVFSGITFGLFTALGVEIPTLWARLIFAGGAGLIPIVATAVIYDPTSPPAGQPFDEGLSRLVALLMRLLLPLTLIVLVVYLAFIPFNFREPYENRDVLIIYNAMLFAVIALLVGATPVRLVELSPRVARWLRGAIIGVAALALVVSLYALSAILYRTAIDRMTPNRLVFIGWNVVNIGLLVLLLLYQARAGAGRWLDALYRAFSVGTVAYAGWTLLVILAIPWLFGVDRAQVETLPTSVQEILFEYDDPILLKCRQSDPIYLLERGEKRWIEDIPTFTARGYEWRDVRFVPCDDLRSVPDGAPIPTDAGPPPQP